MHIGYNGLGGVSGAPSWDDAQADGPGGPGGPGLPGPGGPSTPGLPTPGTRPAGLPQRRPVIAPGIGGMPQAPDHMPKPIGTTMPGGGGAFVTHRAPEEMPDLPGQTVITPTGPEVTRYDEVPPTTPLYPEVPGVPGTTVETAEGPRVPSIEDTPITSPSEQEVVLPEETPFESPKGPELPPR
jgi:hypothetical protein